MISGLTSSEFTERLAYGALVDGRWRKHIKILRDRLSLGQQLLASRLLALDFELFCEPNAGMFLWARHPAVQNAGELAYKAAEQDILLGPGHLFSVDLEPSPWLRSTWLGPTTRPCSVFWPRSRPTSTKPKVNARTAGTAQLCSVHPAFFS